MFPKKWARDSHEGNAIMSPMNRSLGQFALCLILFFFCNDPCFGSGKKVVPMPNLKVAFIGDQGMGRNAKAVLKLIKEEGAHMVIHSGDFDYKDDPLGWDEMITGILGESFPYFASVGNHELAKWEGYQKVLTDRLTRIN